MTAPCAFKTFATMITVSVDAALLVNVALTATGPPTKETCLRSVEFVNVCAAGIAGTERRTVFTFDLLSSAVMLTEFAFAVSSTENVHAAFAAPIVTVDGAPPLTL